MTEKNDSPIPTGFLELDTALDGGLPRGVLTILTSPFTAEGKTSFAVSILCHVSRQSKLRSIIFSLEGTSRDIGFKLAAMETGVHISDTRQGSITEEEYGHLKEASQAIKKWQLWIDENHMESVATMREHITETFSDNYPDFIVIDYLDLMDIVGYQAKLVGLRLLARDSNAAILVVSHTIKERLTQEMMMQHAPTLLVLNREDQSREARLDIWQKKTTRSLPLYFYPPTTRFFNGEGEFRQTYPHARL